MPKFTYNIDPEFFDKLLESIPSGETKMLIDRLIASIDRIEAHAAESSDPDYVKGVEYAVEYLQCAIEDYLTYRNHHQMMIERPPSNPDRN